MQAQTDLTPDERRRENDRILDGIRYALKTHHMQQVVEFLPQLEASAASSSVSEQRRVCANLAALVSQLSDESPVKGKCLETLRKLQNQLGDSEARTQDFSSRDSSWFEGGCR